MRNTRSVVIVLSVFSLSAADQAWRGKQFPEWTEEDAKEVMADSPWAKTATPTVVASADHDNQPRQSGSRRRGGIGVGGIGIGLPGLGRGTQSDKGSTRPAPAAVQIPKLTLRWESALPMREAELKAHDAGAPALDEDHYVIAVYGIPSRDLTDDSEKMAGALKKLAFLKPEVKRNLKPSSVEILLREDGSVVVYSFPKSDEINWRDHRIDFTAQIAKFKVVQSFSTDDMLFQGKLEL